MQAGDHLGYYCYDYFFLPLLSFQGWLGASYPGKAPTFSRKVLVAYTQECQYVAAGRPQGAPVAGLRPNISHLGGRWVGVGGHPQSGKGDLGQTGAAQTASHQAAPLNGHHSPDPRSWASERNDLRGSRRMRGPVREASSSSRVMQREGPSL